MQNVELFVGFGRVGENICVTERILQIKANRSCSIIGAVNVLRAGKIGWQCTYLPMTTIAEQLNDSGYLPTDKQEVHSHL